MEQAATLFTRYKEHLFPICSPYMSKFIPPPLRHLFFGTEDRRRWGKILKNSSRYYFVTTSNFSVASDFFQSVASYLELVGTKGFQTVWKQSNFMWKKLGFRIESDGGFMDLATSSRFLFVLEVWFRILCYTRLQGRVRPLKRFPWWAEDCLGLD